MCKSIVGGGAMVSAWRSSVFFTQWLALRSHCLGGFLRCSRIETSALNAVQPKQSANNAKNAMIRGLRFASALASISPGL